MAHLEAAAIEAFEILATELEHHGAPASLVARARRAARDEERHARIVGALAAREGAKVPRTRVRRGAVRTLEAIARENVSEGCVRETYGAAVAWVQATRASDPRVRRAMRRIARDETRHAELSWAVARWIEATLDRHAQRRLAAVRARAVETLRSDLGPEAPSVTRIELGLPTSREALSIFEAMRSRLWSKAA
jgi:hypothetical protein